MTLSNRTGFSEVEQEAAVEEAAAEEALAGAEVVVLGEAPVEALEAVVEDPAPWGIDRTWSVVEADLHRIAGYEKIWGMRRGKRKTSGNLQKPGGRLLLGNRALNRRVNLELWGRLSKLRLSLNGNWMHNVSFTPTRMLNIFFWEEALEQAS